MAFKRQLYFSQISCTNKCDDSQNNQVPTEGQFRFTSLKIQIKIGSPNIKCRVLNSNEPSNDQQLKINETPNDLNYSMAHMDMEEN